MFFGSFTSMVAVTPHASNDNAYRALYCVATGTTPSVTVTTKNGNSVQITMPTSGQAILLPIQTTLVTAATNTTVYGLN